MTKRFKYKVYTSCMFGVVKLTKNADPNIYGYVVLALDLLHAHNFCYQAVRGVKMLLFVV